MVTKFVIVIAFIVLLVVADIFIQKRSGSVRVTQGRHSDKVLRKGKPAKKARVSDSVDSSEHHAGLTFAVKPPHIGTR